VVARKITKKKVKGRGGGKVNFSVLFAKGIKADLCSVD